MSIQYSCLHSDFSAKFFLLDINRCNVVQLVVITGGKGRVGVLGESCACIGGI